MALTPHQKKILDFIRNFSVENGFAPSQTEIAKHFNYRSLGTVQKYLTRLREQGLLDSRPNARRGLSVKTSKTTSRVSLTLPLLGRVAAGKPIEIIENQDDSEQIEVPSSLVKRGRGDHFILEVTGSSMIEDGILNGDWIIVKKQKSAERGQMIVALVNDSATVKRFHPQNGFIELHSSHPEYPPIRVSPEQSFQIQGIVAGVMRKVL